MIKIELIRTKFLLWKGIHEENMDKIDSPDRSSLIRYSFRGKIKGIRWIENWFKQWMVKQRNEEAGATFFSNKFGNHRLLLINYNPPNSHRVKSRPRLWRDSYFTKSRVFNRFQSCRREMFLLIKPLSKSSSKPSFFLYSRRIN